MSLLVGLGLAVQTESGIEIIGKKKKTFTDKEIQRLEALRCNFIEQWEQKFQMNNTYNQPVKIQYDNQGENPITNWFHTASRYEPTNTNTFLFGETIKNAKGVVGNFFVPWELKFISFTNPIKKFKTELGSIEVNDEDDTMEPSDDGTGPSSSFLSQLWSQISTITVQQLPVDGSERRIFEDFGECIVPTPDIRRPVQALPYYQAIGRIIAYCILNKQLIANHVLPDLYKNYLLRDISPLDPEYDLSDLLNDFYGMMKINGESTACLDERIEYLLAAYGRNEDDPSLKDTDSMSQKEKRFRKCIDAEIFRPRRRALDAMKQGIRLEGCVPCEQCFSVIPLEAVKKLLFDDVRYDLDFVLSRMEPIHEFGDFKIDTKAYIDTQNQFFRVSSNLKDREGTLVDVLRKKCAENKEFIGDFIWFVTGLHCIRQSDFKIIVECNYSENMHDDSLPIVHTCENTIKFPALVYNNNAEKLENKLDYAMQNAKKCPFDMA